MSVTNHPNKNKRTHEQMLATCEPVSNLFNDDKFVTIPSHQIATVLNAYDTELEIQNAAHILLQTLLSGGVHFSRKGYTQKGNIAKLLSASSQVFAVKIWRYLFACNFVAVIVNKAAMENQEDPLPFVCLPIENLEVQYHMNALGKTTFRYLMTDGMGNRREIQNVHTFCRGGPIVDPLGNLVSVVANLLNVSNLYNFMEHASKVAWFTQSHPVLITEAIPQKNDQDILPALPNLGMLNGDGTTANEDGYHAETSVTITEMGVGHADYASSRIPWHGELPFKQAPVIKNNFQSYSTVLNLDANRRLVQGPVPEAPGNLLETDVAKREKIYIAFGIPLHMVSNAVAAKAVGVNGSSNNKRSSASPSMTIFQNYVKELKKLTIHIFEISYNVYYLPQNFEQTKKDMVKDRRSGFSKAHITMDDLISKAKVHVTIPGTPDDDKLYDLLIMGALKYESFVRFQSQIYDIPIDDFNKVMKPIDLNPSKTGPISKSAAKAKATPKKKTKTKTKTGTKSSSSSQKKKKIKA